MLSDGSTGTNPPAPEPTPAASSPAPSPTSVSAPGTTTQDPIASPVVRETLAEKLGTVPPAQPEKGEASVFYQFVIFPLIVVLVAVSIYGFFRWVASDRKSYGEYLNEIQGGWKQRRAEAAYQLIFRVADQDDELRKTADVPATLAVFEAAKKDQENGPKVRRYLAVVLGYLADQQAVPALIEAAGTGEPDAETRLNAAIALGLCHDSSALGPLCALLDDPFEGLRLAAAHALGELKDKSAGDALAKRLGVAGEEVDVRWNAALSLARLGDERAVPTLTSMLDRKYLESIQGKRDAEHTPMSDKQREDVLVNALRGVLVLATDKDLRANGRVPQATAALEAVSRLADGDPDLKVRQAALEVRDQLKQVLAAPAH